MNKTINIEELIKRDAINESEDKDMISIKADNFREYIKNKLDECDMKSLNEVIKDYDERIDLLYDRLNARDNAIDIMLETIIDNDDIAIEILRDIILKLISQ